MPYFEIDDETYNAMDSSLKSKMKTYEPEDVTRLKSKANELLSEKKTVEADLARAKADLAQAKLKGQGEGDGDAAKLQSMLDDAKSQIEEWKGKHTSLESDIRDKTIDGEAMRLATSLTKDADRASLLKQQIRNRLTLDGDNFSVLDENGKPTISSLDELTGQMKAAYPFLVDGSQASGGGAKGGSGGAAVKTLKDMSMTERAQLANSDPDKYQTLVNGE